MASVRGARDILNDTGLGLLALLAQVLVPAFCIGVVFVFIAAVYYADEGLRDLGLPDTLSVLLAMGIVGFLIWVSEGISWPLRQPRREPDVRAIPSDGD